MPSKTPQEIPSWIAGLPSARATDIVIDRATRYGSPLPIGITTVAFWNEWLRIDGVTDPDGIIREISVSRDYAPMLALHKLARQCHKDLEDNIDDVAGYMNVHRMIERDI